MNKPLVKIIDNQFSHCGQGSFGAGDLRFEPNYFSWYRGNDNINDVVVFTENCANRVDEVSEKVKILLIIESPLSNENIYHRIVDPKLYSKFDFILTFNMELLKLDKRFIWYPFGGCWINEQDRSLYTKNKNISIIASKKRDTEGHRLRHDAIAELGAGIDGVFGNGYQFVENKITALKDYRYSIVIENDNCPDMFSEKIIDCFVTGTVPIYWGSGGNIERYFNKNGVLYFNDIDQLKNIVCQVGEQDYNSRIQAIQDNFNRAKQYTIPEDYIWTNFLEKIILAPNKWIL